jgi:transmembrane sensor
MNSLLFEELLARQFFGTITPEEKEQLEFIITTDPQKQYQYRVLEEWMQKKQGADTATDELWQAHYQKHKALFDDVPQNRRTIINIKYIKWLAAAACVVLMIGVGWVYFTTKKEMVFYSTANNEQRTICLPDNSMAVLNANSSVTYDAGSFNKANRTLQMTGEVYFDVQKKKVPFLVNVENITIRVLGTAFNVKAYKNQKEIETSLYRGKIEMVLKGGNQKTDKKITLLPNKKVSVLRNSETLAETAGQKNTDIKVSSLTQDSYNGKAISRDTAWLQRQLLLNNQSFASFAQDLTNRYGKKIIIKDPEVAAYIYSGSIPMVSIEKVLNALSSIQSFHYKIENNDVIINK